MRPNVTISGFVGIAVLCSFGVHKAAFAQTHVKLAVPESEPVKNMIPISSIAFSPDGQLVATGHGLNEGMLQEPRPGQTILWDVRTGKRVRTIPALEDGVHSVAFSPDGKALAILEFTGIIRLIAVPEGREVRKFQTKKVGPTFCACAFFPNNKHLAAGLLAPAGGPNEIMIFDIASGKQFLTLAGHGDFVSSVAISPNGKMLASGAFDGTARVWDALTGKHLLTVEFPSLAKKLEDEDEVPWVQSVAFSPDSQILAAVASIAFESAAVEVWDVSVGKRKVTLTDLDPEVCRSKVIDGKSAISDQALWGFQQRSPRGA